MSNASFFILIVILLFALMLCYTIFVFKSVVRKATLWYIIPALQNSGCTFLKIESFFNPFNIFKKKGDYQDDYESVFHDTIYNRKVYAYVYYTDKNGFEKRVTAKIHCNIFESPIKVEFKPVI
ncbi:hypothetical protein CAP35_12270 [Chitinophagaceae bacterium IBVUCB1]|nr:hypothetical protein CAP35_12270 [Chitinophagaceae bacterium IBVUCB1]